MERATRSTKTAKSEVRPLQARKAAAGKQPPAPPPSPFDTAEDEALAAELKEFAHLPRSLKFPSPAKKGALRLKLRKRLDHDRALLKELREAVAANQAPGAMECGPTECRPLTGNLEKRNEDPEPGDLNMQLALTRLVSDDGEQELARTNGEAFQIKYNLTNEQMFTLCRLAVQIGFYQDTSDLDSYLKKYAQMNKGLRALTPDSARSLGLTEEEMSAVLIGSCSCSCP